MADFGIGWSMPLTRPRILHLARNDFPADWLPPMWGSPASRHASYSPVLRTRIEWSAPNVTAQDVDLVAYDSTNDNATNYDTFFVEARGVESPPGRPAGGHRALGQGQVPGRPGDDTRPRPSLLHLQS